MTPAYLRRAEYHPPEAVRPRWVRELVITALALLVTMALACVAVFAEEPCPIPGIDSPSRVSPQRFEECRAAYLRTSPAFRLAGFLLALSLSLGVIACVLFFAGDDMDIGLVTPGWERRPRV